MSGQTIVRGEGMGDMRMFDQSVLDQALPYPSDMAGLPTSTPNPANLNRRSRRSWFETTPKGHRFEIAVEKPQVTKPVRRESGNTEVLTLTHFSAPPRLGFGTLKLGQERTCTLLLRNPHDCEQSVKVEKVPEKKHFTVTCREIVVGPHESFPLEVTWAPKEAGGFREMILMQVDESYRVQAYVFGTCTAPPPPKKKTGKRIGLMATKVSKPFSVIHTTSLANINHEYSPEKKYNKPTNKAKTRPLVVSKGPIPSTRGSRGRSSTEARRCSGRLSGQNKDKENVQANTESDFKVPEMCGIENVSPIARQTQKMPKQEDGSIPRKKIRRSNTYSNVSGLGLVVPVIHNEEVMGHRDTSLLSTDISPVQADTGSSPDSTYTASGHMVNQLPSFLDTDTTDFKKPPSSHVGAQPSFIEIDADRKSIANNGCNNLEPSFLAEEKFVETKTNSTSRISKPGKEPHNFTNQDTTSEPSFLIHSNEPAFDQFHDSLGVGGNENKPPLEEPSFLASDNCSKPRRSLRKRSGTFTTGEGDSTGIKLLRNAKKNTSKQKRRSKKLSIEGLQQSPILAQLKNLRSFIHDKSLEIENSGNESLNTEVESGLERRETFVHGELPPKISMSATDNICRGTFVADPIKNKLLETQKPSEASPRRTTFTVVKNATKKPQKLLTQSHMAMSFMEEEVAEDCEVTETINNAENAALENAVKEQFDNAGNSRVTTQKGNLNNSCNEVRNHSFDSYCKSPQMIQQEDDNYSRRCTLTVTKVRPSDALLENHGKKNSHVSAALFPPPSASTEECDDDSLEKTEEVKSSNNSTFEVSAERSILLKDADFQPTLKHLPSSPQLNHSRRSTHVVTQPKIISMSDHVAGKQLFIPEIVINTDSDMLDVTEASTGSKVDTDSLENDTTGREITEVDVFSPPSANTRRRTLSAKRKSTNSLSKHSLNEQTTAATVLETETLKNNCLDQVDNAWKQNKDIVPEALVFIPLNKSGSELTKRPVEKANPRNFLKKRSNSQTKEFDARNKRVCSESALSSKHAETTKLVTKTNSKPPGSLRNARQVQKPKPSLVKGLAQSRLILSKKSKSVIPKHPLPFAARNMFYDERWMEKQERGFVNWLNFILTPTDEITGSDKKVRVDAGKLTVDMCKGRVKLAPTNEILSLRAYSAQRKLNRLRKSACRLFQSDGVREVMQKLEREVESKRLLVRKDKMLHADVGAKQKVLDMLLSYNPLWLRVGLETIYGEVVPLQCNTDVYGLSQFIITRLLSSPDLLQEYAHPTVPHLYKDGYAGATSQHTLKKFLMLVYFLDQAKQNRLIEHNLCLFCKDADVKASKDLLLQFSRDFLSGEGDITRHLGYLNYKVTYTQTVLDEFDFAVKSLASDLRDGVRLTRVMEMLCHRTDMSRTLRLPAISKLQKVYNMKLVFTSLDEQNIPCEKVTAQDVVEGHREKTLKLLWAIILHYQVSVLINMDQLREEINVLEKSLRVKTKLQELNRLLSDLVEGRRESHGGDLHTQDERLNLLLRWCRAVCAHFNIKIENFTVSFSDGRALCHILHYYHPGLIPLSKINNNTMITNVEMMEQKCQQNLETSLNDSINSSTVFGEMNDPAEVNRLLANEKENFKLLAEKVKELGGVPMMLHWSDMSNTIPDEKVVVTYLLYLCSRLLDIRHESRAARVIQLAWRKYMVKKMEKELVEKSKAVVILQRTVRSFLSRRRAERRNSAALCIQKYWKGHRARKAIQKLKLDQLAKQQLVAITKLQNAVKSYLYRRRYLQMKKAVVQIQACCRGYLHRRQRNTAATVIQRMYRGHKIRREMQRKTTAVVKLQALVRGHLAKQQLKAIKNAVAVVQQRFRAKRVMMEQRSDYQRVKRSVIFLQAQRKMVQQRSTFLRTHLATVKLQACTRMFLEKQKYKKLKTAAVTLQRFYRLKQEGVKCRRDYLITVGVIIFMQSQRRMIMQQRKYNQLRAAVIKVQSLVRMKMQRSKFLEMNAAAVRIQSMVRAYRVRKAYKVVLEHSRIAALTIQAAYKGWLVRRQFIKERHSAIVIQSWVRRHQCQIRYQRLGKAVTFCQRIVRAKQLGNKVCTEYKAVRTAAVCLQAAYRGLTCRRDYVKLRNSIVKVQSLVRMKRARVEFQKQKQASVSIQRWYRACIAGQTDRKRFLLMKGAAITIQAAFRGHVVRSWCLQTLAARKIQSTYRMYRNRKSFQQTRTNVIVCQSMVRRWLAVKRLTDLRTQYRAATIIQSKWRAWQEGRRQIQKYQDMRKGAIVIQRCFRAKLARDVCRKAYLTQVDAVIKLQYWWKMILERQQYLRVRTAVTRIQAGVRMLNQRNQYLKLKESVLRLQSYIRARRVRRAYLVVLAHSHSAATVIQAAYRRYKVRQEYLRQRHAAIVIQSQLRCCIQTCRYRSLRKSVLFCQSTYRAKLLCRVTQEEYIKRKRAAVVIQSAFRGRQCRQEFSRIRMAAIKIQACSRMMTIRNEYRRMKHSAVVIQRWYKGAQVTKKLRMEFLVRIGAAITIQAAYKRFIIRKIYLQVLAARKIQALFRMYLARKTYLTTLQKVVKCQAAVRRHLAMRKFDRLQALRRAVVVIQRQWRARQLCHMQKDKFQKQRSAALALQAHFRAYVIGRLCRREYLVMKGAAITCQAFFRGYLVRQKKEMQVVAVTKIQSVFRTYQAMKAYRKVQTAVISCQRIYRAKLQAKQAISEFEKLKMSAISLQAQSRMMKCRKTYLTQRKSAITIQSWYRAYHARRLFLKSRKAVTDLQTRWRAELVCRQHVLQYHRLRDAVIMIQSYHRANVVRRRLAQTQAAVKIQSFYRMTVARRRFQRLRSAAGVIQRQVKRRQARQELQRLLQARLQARQVYLARVAAVARVNLCAVKIQRFYRHHKMMKLASERLHSVVIIQRWIRSRLHRLQFLRDRHNIVQVQCCVRTWLARRDKASRVIQRAFRLWRPKIAERKQVEAAVVIQAVWRGYHTRRSSCSKKLAKARARVIEANASATEEKKLGNRTSSALDFLLKYKHVSQVFEALGHLEVATRLSSVCCERMVETNSISVLYRLLRVCNRSIPHMEVIKFTINIMLNLAKYAKTRPSLYEDDTGISTLLELMQIYREKGAIFIKTCTLMGILALDAPCRNKIVENQKIVEKLRSIHTLTSRKHKLEESQRVTRARMNSTFNSTFVVRSPVKKPKIKPEWSLNKDKMSEIQNPLKAINFVMTHLGIQPK